MTGCAAAPASSKLKCTAGIQLANLDTTASAGNGLFTNTHVAVGSKNNPHSLPNIHSYGSFTDPLQKTTVSRLQGLIEELAATQHEAGSVAHRKSVTCTKSLWTA